MKYSGIEAYALKFAYHFDNEAVDNNRYASPAICRLFASRSAESAINETLMRASENANQCRDVDDELVKLMHIFIA